MTFEESKQWLLSQCKASEVSPYKFAGLLEPMDRFNNPYVPVCKLYDAPGGTILMFLTRNNDFVYWQWVRDSPVKLPGEYVLHELIPNNQMLWEDGNWTVTAPPWEVSDWYMKEGML